MDPPFGITLHDPIPGQRLGASRYQIEFARYFELALLCSILGFGLGIFYWRSISQQRLLANEKKRSHELLLNILPTNIADRLLLEGRPIADLHSGVTILFADIVGFTEFSRQNTPSQVVNMLDEVFSTFDDMAIRHGVEKIKTIGDAYMASSGVPVKSIRHAESVADLALDMLAYLNDLRSNLGVEIKLRVGIHSGDVVAGIIGKNKFSYDIWGDAVNQASRLESNAVVSTILVSSETYNLLKYRYILEAGGVIDLKGLGPTETYFLKSKIVQE